MEEFDLDGSGGRLYAKGLRNAVGMAVNPWTHQIWIDVNGRDYLGDNCFTPQSHQTPRHQTPHPPRRQAQ